MADKLNERIAELQGIQKKKQTLESNIKVLEAYIKTLNAQDTSKYTRTMECVINIDLHDGDYPNSMRLRVPKITPAIRDVLVAECERQIKGLKEELEPIINEYC